MQPVDMSMDDIELGGTSGHRFEQCCLGRHRIRTRTAKAKRARPHWVEMATRSGIAAREQRYLMSKVHQFLNQPCDHTLCPPVQFWRNAFSQRGDLCNPHDISDWSPLQSLRSISIAIARVMARGIF